MSAFAAVLPARLLLQRVGMQRPRRPPHTVQPPSLREPVVRFAAVPEQHLEDVRADFRPRTDLRPALHPSNQSSAKAPEGEAFHPPVGWELTAVARVLAPILQMEPQKGPRG